MANRLPHCSLVLLSIVTTFATRPIAAADPATAPARSTPIDVADKQAVQAAMAHDVVVKGKVSDIKNTDSVTTIVLEGTEKSQFNSVVLQRNREAVEKVHGDGLKSLAGKQVQIKGAIALYRDKPQIVVSRPEQISIVGDTQPQAAQSKESPSVHPTVIDAADKAGLDAALPQIVTVKGTISEIKNDAGVTSINFDGAEKSGFYAVVLSRNRDAVEKVFGAGLKSLVGKPVQMSGKIVEYRNRPEIVVSAPEQVVVLEK